MELKEIVGLIATKSRVKAFEKMLYGAQGGRGEISGLAGSSLAVMLSRVKRGETPILIIAEDYDSAGYLYNDLWKLDSDGAYMFPSGYRRHIKYGQPDAPNQILRTETLGAWRESTTRWVVTYPDALAEKVPMQEEFQGSTFELRKDDKIEMGEIREYLLDHGFKRVDYVYEPGQFSVRGSILDIFSYSSELPYRIDFFDDEIDSIRTFDIETQLSTLKCDRVTIIPDIGVQHGEKGVSLLEYISNDTPIIVCGKPLWLTSRIKEIAESKIAAEVEISGEGDADAMSNVVDTEAFFSRLKEFRIIETGALTSTAPGESLLSFDFLPQTLFHKNFQLISESFSRFISEGYKILILSDSPSQTQRLRAIFADRGDSITFTEVFPTLHAGFSDAETKVCVYTDHQIFDRFHKFNLRNERARTGKLALSIKELNKLEMGDYVVHTDHGIGRFGGLVRTDVAGKPQEMIKLLYSNDDIIFVSIHSLHKLSKYRGAEGATPKLSKLGSGAWNRLKERTKTKVKDIARDLIKLYAARREEKGFAYSPDSYLQHELEASFIYEDTPDQMKAVAAIKEDMEKAMPMDRLVCGDVGFGKTEVAIRAAFKAAADSKQTAVLVPTTVLALQHYNTFSHRLADLPVRVEFISRAKKPKEVKQILRDLKDGKIDILIGTHRIIGKDVQFKDLGLLIIDEEQKFGVAVKEKLKQLKVNVDTLTMSATPIPRTLQFSLMGARDLSNLNTPPANRRPVMTTVAPMSDEVVADAIRFELSRNGQIFFICNRIERMAQIENMLLRLIPDLRIVKGHGQLPPDELEKAIYDFSNHDYDLLLATTIVENGIDMPNVNTIFVDNAQNFGLSELHQLRGRVGRSSRKAFAYLLVPPGKSLTPIARRRLQAIESFSGLGCGIHIAMQDLDIRGAGNLLGAEQSGFIADLGYETYQKILKESVIELRTEEFADTFGKEDLKDDQEFVADCSIESDMELMIPPVYVPQESERITLYRQLDGMEGDDEIEAFRAMLRDRFGVIPDVTEELICIVALRRIAKQLGVERLNLKNGNMYIYFVDASNKAYYNSNAFGRILTYVQRNPSRCTLRQKGGKNSISISGVKRASEALEIMRGIAKMPIN